MGMKEKCVCSTGRGFWDEQNCWLCKLCIWFLMNLSLPAHWLLSCYCWQETSSINTHTLAHIHKNFICSAKISCIRRHAQNFILWRSEGSLQTQGRIFFTRAEVWYWLALFLCSTRAIYIISESFMYHWAYTCDWGALHVGLLCSYFFQDFPRVNRERSEHSWRGTTVCVCVCRYVHTCVSTGLGCFSPARSHRVNIYSVFWDLKKGNLFQYLWMWSNIKSSHSFQKPWQYACTRTDWRLKSKRKPHTARSDQVMEFIDIGG